MMKARLAAGMGRQIKPVLLENLFETLREYPALEIPCPQPGDRPDRKIEVAMIRDFSAAHTE